MHNSNVFFYSTLLFYCGLVSSIMVLYGIHFSKNNFLSFLHVKADKSATNASLLGGLSISASILVSIFITLKWFDQSLSIVELSILKLAIFPIALTTIYGYLDDKFEIRARHKLIFQILAIGSFIFPLAYSHLNFNPYFTSLAFVFGLAFINGSNLIDGLDTLFIKIGTITSLGFLVYAIESLSLTGILFSIASITALISFYRFNKEPAKIYAGEIGGSVLGLIFFIQSISLILKLNTSTTNFDWAPVFRTILISVYPLSELGITFTRRVFFKKSPFRGDHLHIHHIIKSKFQLRASKTSNLLGIILLLTYLTASMVQFKTNYFNACTVAVLIFCTVYFLICYSSWFNNNNSSSDSNILNSIKQKPIYLIDSKSIDLLYCEINDPSTAKEKKNIA